MYSHQLRQTTNNRPSVRNYGVEGIMKLIYMCINVEESRTVCIGTLYRYAQPTQNTVLHDVDSRTYSSEPTNYKLC